MKSSHMTGQAKNPCLRHGSALLHLPPVQILGLLGALPPGPLGLHPIYCLSQSVAHCTSHNLHHSITQKTHHKKQIL